MAYIYSNWICIGSHLNVFRSSDQRRMRRLGQRTRLFSSRHLPSRSFEMPTQRDSVSRIGGSTRLGLGRPVELVVDLDGRPCKGYNRKGQASIPGNQWGRKQDCRFRTLPNRSNSQRILKMPFNLEKLKYIVFAGYPII